MKEREKERGRKKERERYKERERDKERERERENERERVMLIKDVPKSWLGPPNHIMYRVPQIPCPKTCSYDDIQHRYRVPNFLSDIRSYGNK